ncbi:endonuclease I family protein [Myroides sp. LJL119]
MKKISFLLLLLTIGWSAYSCSSDESNPEVQLPEQPQEPQEPEQPEEPQEPEDPKDGKYTIPADQIAYYKDVDFTKTGSELKQELASLIKITHTNAQKYQWEHFKETDITQEGNEVYLLYGHKGVTQGEKAYTRGKNQHGGNQNNWNREHVFAKSLANPKLTTNSPGAGTDAHNLRPADVTWNQKRGNLPFIQGQGFSGKVENGWYPGDEWKGDVARMMMYMYLRYDNQCLPTKIAIGEINELDSNMIDLLLDWNAEDPVSPIEVKRNTYHGDTQNPYAQGNRNPFIDNPDLATQIWGGKKAQNLWQ